MGQLGAVMGPYRAYVGIRRRLSKSQEAQRRFSWDRYLGLARGTIPLSFWASGDWDEVCAKGDLEQNPPKI